MVTTILCIIGLAGQTKLKHLGNWIKDEDRYNPTNITPTRVTSLTIDTKDELSVSLKEPPMISDLLWKQIIYHLQNLRLSEDSTQKIIHVLKTATPITHSRKLYQELSLIDKWYFAALNIRGTLIPILVSMKKDKHTKDVSKHTSHLHSVEGLSQNQNHITTSDIFIPSHLAYSTDALYQFQHHASSPHQNKMVNFHTTSFFQDPILLIITNLYDLSMIFHVHTAMYVKCTITFVFVMRGKSLYQIPRIIFVS
jgi:hypothetical protein